MSDLVAILQSNRDAQAARLQELKEEAARKLWEGESNDDLLAQPQIALVARICSDAVARKIETSYSSDAVIIFDLDIFPFLRRDCFFQNLAYALESAGYSVERNPKISHGAFFANGKRLAQINSIYDYCLGNGRCTTYCNRNHRIRVIRVHIPKTGK